MSHILSLNALKKFDWEIYLLNYPELTDLQTQQDTVLHYAHVGHLENRTDQISELFDWERYANAYKHLWLITPREAYIHFMRHGLKYKQENSSQPLHMLIIAQYDKIIEHNQSRIRTPTVPMKPFTLPPRPKNQTSSPEHRQPHAPNVLNPPKQPLKTPRSDDTIADRLQPRVAAINPPVKQQIKTTASSIIKPTPTQKPAPQKRLPAHMWPPRQVEEKRSPQAPPIFQPLKQPTRSSIIHTSVNNETVPTPSQQPTIPPPLEPAANKRSSHAPSILQPLKQPTRSGIIHTNASGETITTPPRRLSQQPPSEHQPEIKRSSHVPSQFQPLKQPSRSSIIQTNSKEDSVATRPLQWPPSSTAKLVQKRRSSQAPPQFQPLKHPSRSNIIKTKTAEETIAHTWRPKPASVRHAPEKPVFQPYKHPARASLSKQKTQKEEPSFAIYPFQPLRKPKLAVKSIVATRFSQKKLEMKFKSPSPFWYSQKCAVRKPKEGELVLKEPPSKYFSRIGVIIGPPRYLN